MHFYGEMFFFLKNEALRSESVKKCANSIHEDILLFCKCLCLVWLFWSPLSEFLMSFSIQLNSCFIAALIVLVDHLDEKTAAITHLTDYNCIFLLSWYFHCKMLHMWYARTHIKMPYIVIKSYFTRFWSSNMCVSLFLF